MKSMAFASLAILLLIVTCPAQQVSNLQNWEKEFNRQVSNLVEAGWPEAISISAQQFEVDLLPFRLVLSKKFSQPGVWEEYAVHDLPFLIVPHNLSYQQAMGLLKDKDGNHGQVPPDLRLAGSPQAARIADLKQEESGDPLLAFKIDIVPVKELNLPQPSVSAFKDWARQNGKSWLRLREVIALAVQTNVLEPDKSLIYSSDYAGVGMYLSLADAHNIAPTVAMSTWLPPQLMSDNMVAICEKWLVFE